MVEIEKEVWRRYPEINWVMGSNFGNMKTLDHYVNGRWGKTLIKGHELKQRRNKDGYMRVGLKVNGKKVNLSVHRIIASCFLSNPDGLEQVNHKNCNRADNRIENLEWCTRRENIAYRDKLGHTARHNKPKSPVIAVNLKTSEVSRFESQSEAARQLGASVGNINNVIKGRLNKHHGYWFVKVDDNAVEAAQAKFGNTVAAKVEALMAKNNVE